MSWAGPLIRLSSAPALAVAAWRLLFSTAFVALVLAWRGRHPIRLGAGEGALALVSGVLLAGHFWSWIASLSLTSVASSVVLVSMQPIFVAGLSALFLAERPTPIQWLGILLAVGGTLIIGWGDFTRGRAPLMGDLLALVGAVLVSGYYVIGRRLRQRLDLWSYVGVVYGIAAAVLALVLALAPATPFASYPLHDWLIFLALAAGPMMLGHTGVNYALRYRPAYVANVVLLGEPIGATLLAWSLPQIRERPPVQTLIGGALILAGIALGVRRRADGASHSDEMVAGSAMDSSGANALIASSASERRPREGPAR